MRGAKARFFTEAPWRGIPHNLAQHSLSAARGILECPIPGTNNYHCIGINSLLTVGLRRMRSATETLFMLSFVKCLFQCLFQMLILGTPSLQPVRSIR